MTVYSSVDGSDLKWWYWLASVKGLGPAYTRTLIDAFGSPECICEATKRELEQAITLPTRTWAALEKSKESLPRFASIAERQSKTADAMGARILTLHSPDYPEFLRCIPKQAPPVIHVQGDLGLVRPRSVAVVGTRSPSDEAVERVRTLSAYLCEQGFPVVAGMARGIDTSAHRGALESAGMTIGVLGSGLDRIYPPENAPLYVETRQRGLLISQFPFGSAPSPANLRQRNKLIVALAEAVVIAESDVQGGAMIAARSALEQGRNLFALQWSDMQMPSRAGTHRLLETNLARPVDQEDTDSLFNTPLFRGSGATAAKAWEAAFPSSGSTRSSGNSRHRQARKEPTSGRPVKSKGQAPAGHRP